MNYERFLSVKFITFKYKHKCNNEHNKFKDKCMLVNLAHNSFL